METKRERNYRYKSSCFIPNRLWSAMKMPCILDYTDSTTHIRYSPLD
uniref:Uncharacterized protein n=1 Tax=Anguilla anguilla TaxID=7936 RepID=A0A0E9TAG7_ANGAN